jgi:hypothetical protein
MSSQKNQDLVITSTCILGRNNNNEFSKIYDIRDKVGKKILDYRLIKIKCQLKSNDCIYGIQFIYRNINTNKEETLINVEPKDLDLSKLIEQEMDFGLEEIVDFRTWLSEETKLIGFEVTTNRGRTQKFGFGNDEELRKCPNFESKDNCIVGFGVVAEEKNGIVGIYAYFIRKKLYSFYSYNGVFKLRIKIKNEEYKKQIESKISTLSDKNKILYKVCSLPDNQFFNIIKYTLC